MTEKTPQRSDRGGRLCIGLGAVLLAFAITWTLYCFPSQLTLPLSMDQRASAEGTGTVLDLASLDSDELRVDHDVPIHYVQQVTGVEPGDADTMTAQIGTTITRTDREGDASLVRATIQRVTIDRDSALPIPDETNSSLQTDADNPSVPLQADGLTVAWPVGTERRDYPFYDATARASRPIEFLDDGQVGNIQVYRFQQRFSDVDLAAVDPTKSFSVPASALPESAPEDLREQEGDVELHMYYSVERTYEVEPRSGQIVNATEDVNQYLGTEPGQEVVPVFQFRATLDEQSVQALSDKARAATRRMDLSGTWLPWVTGIVGSVLLCIGGGRQFSQKRRTSRSG